jgi:hypothetical protein
MSRLLDTLKMDEGGHSTDGAAPEEEPLSLLRAKAQALREEAAAALDEIREAIERAQRTLNRDAIPEELRRGAD